MNQPLNHSTAFPQLFQFTKLEWELIEDRLNLSCCIAEVLEDDYPASAIEERCGALLDYKPGNTLALRDQLDADILADAITGSNAVHPIKDAVDYGEITRGRALALYGAASRVENKTGCAFPRD
tara:strand:+ start:349 stop:720 length:372 start_codon:yes stop_codon:yes gene_type:complete